MPLRWDLVFSPQVLFASSIGTLVVVLALGCALHMWWYYQRIAALPQLMYRSGSIAEEIVRGCTRLHEKYYPPWLFYGAHAQTVGASLFRPRVRLPYRRELLRLPDEGTVALDWVYPAAVEAQIAAAEKPRSKRNSGPTVSATGTDAADQWQAVGAALDATHPLLVVLHGVTGGSNESYVTHLVQQAVERGWPTVVLNARGCADAPVTSKRFYCGAWTADLRHVLEVLQRRYPHAPLAAVGFSLGANILVKAMGEDGVRCRLRAAVSLANPLDLLHGATLLQAGFARVYGSAITRRLRAYARRHAAWLAHEPRRPLHQLRSVWDFDDAVTAPAFGYRDAEAYYRDASSAAHLPGVRVPLLLLNAADDPLAPARPALMRSAPDCVALASTLYGGHVAWAERGLSWRRSWADGVALEFIDVALRVAHGRLAADQLTAGFPLAPY